MGSDSNYDLGEAFKIIIGGDGDKQSCLGRRES